MPHCLRPVRHSPLLLLALSLPSSHAALCDGVARPCPLCLAGAIRCSECVAPVPCVTLRGGVEMPVVGLGTGASAYATQCDEQLPNPPFKNVSCFQEQARRATEAWVGRGGALVEAAQDDLNMVPVGIALQQSGVDRSDVFLETKCIGPMSRDATIECVFDSLQMLQVDYIDLVLFHTPFSPGDCFAGSVGKRTFADCGRWSQWVDPGDKGRQEAWKALEVTVQQGLVRAIGLSDHSVKEIEAILEVATIPPAVVQIPISPLEDNQRIDAFCKRHGIYRQAWGPLGSPMLTGSTLQLDFHDPLLVSIGAAHEVSPYQVVLRWIVQQNATFVVGTGNAAHMVSDADLFKFELTSEEMDNITALGSMPFFFEDALVHDSRAVMAPRSLWAVSVVVLGLALIAFGRPKERQTAEDVLV